ncbi:MAG: type I-E CRISPR-associated endoribonuclease Cas2e [bacterium]|nr:type I-E CRISPR-associated endoribonuclease Cas2e [bacterium]
MTSLVVLDIKKAPKSLTGYLQRIMLEIRPGTFVWKLSSRKTKQIWDEIKNTECSAICIFAAKTETGFIVASHGQNARQVCDNHGLQLIKYLTVNSNVKLGTSEDIKIID